MATNEVDLELEPLFDSVRSGTFADDMLAELVGGAPTIDIHLAPGGDEVAKYGDEKNVHVQVGGSNSCEEDEKKREQQ